jgi:preprotein translocase subunit SecE
MAKINPMEFVEQVRSEASKVTWPTRKETGITTVMVMIMVFFASLFFLGADTLLSWVVGLVLGR